MTKTEKSIKDLEKDLRTASSLIAYFSSNLNKRTEFFLYAEPDFLPEILRLHFFTWKKEQSYLRNTKNDQLWVSFYTIERNLSLFLKEAFQFTLKHVHGLHPFFKAIENHLEKHGKEGASAQDEVNSYLVNFPFFNDFFEILDSEEINETLWIYFPSQWLITIPNLERSVISQRWLVLYMNWALRRVNRTEDDIDWALEKATSNLFPTVDPISWATILNYVFSSKREIRDIIGRRRSFGYMGRIYTGWHDDSAKSFAQLNRSQEAGEQESARLAAFLTLRYQPFAQAFRNIDQSIDSLRKLSEEYINQKEEEAERLMLLNLFLLIKKYRTELKSN